MAETWNALFIFFFNILKFSIRLAAFCIFNIFAFMIFYAPPFSFTHRLASNLSYYFL